jgi:transcriptional regulator with XRE-family HTH domain
MKYNNDIFRERLTKLLEEQGLSDADVNRLAQEKKIHISVTAVRDWRERTKNPTAEKTFEIAEILEVNPAYLLGLTPIEKHLSGIEEQALQTFNIMPLDLQMRMLDVMQIELRHYFEKTLSQARQSIEQLPLHERQRAIGKITNMTNAAPAAENKLTSIAMPFKATVHEEIRKNPFEK